MLIILNKLFFKYDTIKNSLNAINTLCKILADFTAGIAFAGKKMRLQRKLELNSGPRGNLFMMVTWTEEWDSGRGRKLGSSEIPTLLHESFSVLIIPKPLINHALA